MAGALEASTALVVEDDGSPYLSSVAAASVGTYLPDRTVLIRGLSKSHGPDLRVAVLGGAAEVISRVIAVRLFGARWTSRIIQDAAAYLLTDTTTVSIAARAAVQYEERRTTLASALADRSVRTANRDGLGLWIPVHDERHALVTCAAHGIAVSPGSRFCTAPRRAHLRVSPTQLTDGVEEVADLLALAAAQPSR
ncbi:MAG TPA: hypothetical protein VHV47_10875 [Opitutaceae bacterium]|nr:hypothetical protein [Opitutaceae bacterium]